VRSETEKRIESIIQHAKASLLVKTGYIADHEVYYAEVPELKLKCFDFTEEKALELSASSFSPPQ